MGVLIFLLLINLSYISSIHINNITQLFKSEGDLNIALIINNCYNNNNNSQQQKPLASQLFINSAIWTVQRLNFLEFAAPLTLGLTAYETCTEKDNYETIFYLFQGNDEEYFIGILTYKKFTEQIKQFSDVLSLRTRTVVKYEKFLMLATIQLLNTLGWNDNITVIGPNNIFINTFFQYSRKSWICVNDYFIYGDDYAISTQNLTNSLVVFGDNFYINLFLKRFNQNDETNIIFVPLDGSVINNLPENSYVFIPPQVPFSANFRKSVNILPSPLLLEVASPIICYAQTISNFIKENCNETSYKINCLRNKINENLDECLLAPENILDILKIEPLKRNFVYNVFKVENNTFDENEMLKKNNFLQPYIKVFSYNIFENNLTSTEISTNTLNNSTESFCKHNPANCRRICKNYNYHQSLNNFKLTDNQNALYIRSESWVFAFLSLSLLGVLFCIAILIFLLIYICRKDILEGNPVLTMLLLISVMLMYCSVLPLSVDGNKFTKESVCLTRSLAITLSYASAFSLILSRCILLATAAKEIGFMSHIAGPVQSFLCLFIFGVQAALSLQVIGRCHDIFRGYSFIYLLSYNVMLILLLLCLCPLIYKCQRNYGEGKYFTIAVITVSCTWCIWVSTYAIMDEEWKDPILCFGLVSTATVLLSAIFIPRTYLMTIATARDKITSTLPSLATATSAMDIYRASTQPVYDCVNIAAINAASIGNGIVSIQQPDLYSCPNLPEGDLDERCDTPIDTDKVTRF